MIPRSTHEEGKGSERKASRPHHIVQQGMQFEEIQLLLDVARMIKKQ